MDLGTSEVQERENRWKEQRTERSAYFMPIVMEVHILLFNAYFH